MSVSGNGADDAYYNFTDASFTDKSVTDYTFEFDFALGTASLRQTSIWITDQNGNTLFTFKADANNSKTGDLIIGETTNEDVLAMSSSNFNHVKIASNSEGTKLYYTAYGSNTATEYQLSTSFVQLKAFHYYSGKSYPKLALDNFVLSKAVAANYVPFPTATVTTVNGTSRTVSITPASDAVDGTSILYYTSADDADDATKHITYSAPFTTTDATSIYYYASYNGNKSEVKTLTTTAGTEAKVSTPSITRTGDNTYTISATATTVDGIVATQTLHYTVAGGTEQTSTDASVALTNVTGDITAYATSSNGFSQSENATLAYVAPYAGYDVWAYNLNSYPSAYSVTSIADAIASTSVTLNELEVYNLKEIATTYPDLYVDNSSAWLLRNQSSSAFKSQSGNGNIVINNVTTNNMIRVEASSDQGKYSITKVTNGEVSYSYNGKYFIKPAADGAVTVTFNGGTAVNTVAVMTNTAPVTITDAKYATFVTPAALDFSSTDVKAFAVKYDNGAISYSEVTTVPANTAVLVYAAAGTYSIPVAASAEALTDNNLVAATAAVTCDGSQYVLANGDNGLGWYQATSGTIAAGKGYLKVETTTTGEAKSFYPIVDNTVTAIEAVNGEKGAVKNESIYNLAGQRVSGAYKGVVIKGGKKYIVK